jgi:polyisoprenyl-phosphate glycosyltransferase
MMNHWRPQRPSLDAALISVVLPVYNEARVLPQLWRRVTQALAGCATNYEIVLVNDGSSDESPKILEQLAITDRRVRVVHLSRNFGHQAAVQAGLAHARGDAVVLMDSDLQDSPEAIPQFVAHWREGCDVVYAIRSQRKEHLLKRALFTAFHRLMSRVAAVPIPAEAGIFGLVDRRVVSEILALPENDRYFPGLRSWVGFRQRGVIVPRQARYDDHPRVSLAGLVRLAKTAVFSFSTLPLAVFYAIGLTAAGLFVCLSAYSLFCKLFTSLAVPGWTSHVLIGSFFGALNALGISILGEYSIRIYDQVRRRPLYVVDRTVEYHSGYGTPSPAASADAATALASLQAACRESDLVGDQPYAEIMAEAAALLGCAMPHKTAPSSSADADEEEAAPVIPFPRAY